MTGQTPADQNAVISRTLTADVLRQTLELRRGRREAEVYWTPDRIARAKAIPLKRPDQALLESRTPPSAENRFFRAVVGSPYSTNRVADRSKLPYSAIGKLLVTLDGADYAGTAWVVGDRTVITAGHCVFGADWATHAAFMPQFDDEAIKGIWNASTLMTLAGWASGGPEAAAFDLGALILDHPIADVTGIISWRQSSGNRSSLSAVGYPEEWVSSQYDFDGSHMWCCVGDCEGGTTIIAMHNNMTSGCSGGPWLAQDGNRAYACGVNSRYDQQVMFSPAFGTGMANLVRAAKG